MHCTGLSVFCLWGGHEGRPRFFSQILGGGPFQWTIGEEQFGLLCVFGHPKLGAQIGEARAHCLAIEVDRWSSKEERAHIGPAEEEYTLAQLRGA